MRSALRLWLLEKVYGLAKDSAEYHAARSTRIGHRYGWESQHARCALARYQRAKAQRAQFKAAIGELGGRVD